MRLLSLLPVAVGALGLAWLAVAAALVSSFSPHQPLAAAVLANHPAVVLPMAVTRRATAARGSHDRDRQRAIAMLAQEPLSEEPFIIAGTASEPSADAGRALELLEEARRRNPRHTLVRIALIERYVRAARMAPATAEISVLTRLMPEAGGFLVPELARLARDPATRKAVEEALRGDPIMDAVLEHLAREGADSALLLSLARGRASQPLASDPPAWQGLMIDNLVRAGKFGEAQRQWFAFNKVAPSARRDTIYDPQFRGLPGPAPFNWLLREDENGVAERSREGALLVDYFGRTSIELASQLLLLSPGRYRLFVEAEGEGGGEGSRLVWRVICARSQAALAEISLENLASAPRRFGAEFTVPAGGCNAQWIKLDGVSAEFPTTRSARFTGLRLVRTDRPS